MSEKIIHIVGFAPSTRDKAGYNDPNVEVWVLNEYESMLPVGGAYNITRHFELHQRDTVLNSHRDKSYIEKLKASKIPVMMCKKEEDIPMSEEYPLNDIIKALGTDYFTNSISYMLAYAVYVGATKIGLFGVDMAQDEEYAKERPSVEYFVGFARARGIEVYIPPESDICKVPYYYGFQEESASKIVRTIDPKRKDLQVRINNDDNQVDEMQEHIDWNLKKYLFEIKPLVEKERITETKIAELSQKLANCTDEDKVQVLNELREIQKEPIPVKDVLFPMDAVLMRLWDCNQSLRGAKKERLYLAGANDANNHLRKVLCPYD